MCGIAGILHLGRETAPVGEARLRRMTEVLVHRGPDGEGHWCEGEIGLGHRRLAIRDLSDAGRQPMFDASGEIAVTYNGEIYNERELREEIGREAGYQFRTGCDTELLPIGWRLWGERLFDRLEGMYALAIWDRRTHTLVLARDGVGIKPLYWTREGEALLFGSEVKALLAATRSAPVIDAASLHAYLAAGYPEPDASLVAGVHQLSPGTILRVDRGGGITQHRFWQPTRKPTVREPGQAIERLHDVLDGCTKQMLVSDVPVGLMLSSGIDSATLAMLLPGSVPCFTAAFDERSHDETDAARSIAEASRNAWSAVPVAGGAGLIEDFESIAMHVDGQLADSSCLAHFALSRAIRERVTVALAGDGADEFFGGYPTYRASRLASVVSPAVPGALAATLARALAARSGRDERRLPWHDVAARFAAGLPSGDTAHVDWRRLTPVHLLPALYGPAMRSELTTDALARYRSELVQAGGSLVDRCLLADQRVYLPADMLAKVDRMSMAHSLEIRVPFLDRRVMDLAGTISAELLTPWRGPGKRVLRGLLERLRAPSRIAAGRKRGFQVPLARVLRRELRPLGDALLVREPDLFEPLLEPAALRRLWVEHVEGHRNHAYTLWAILIFGAWWRRTRH